MLPAALLGIGDYGVKDTGTIKVLLEFGADPESKWFGLTPLALLCGQAGLASSGLYPPSPWANERESLADERESLDNLLVDVARLILDHGAEVDGMSSHYYGPGNTSNGTCGYTPLMLFAICGYPPLVRLLLNRGADVDVKNDRGHTAEMMALQGDEMQSCPNYSGTQRIEPNDPAKVAHYDALWQLMPNELTDYCLNFWQRDDCLRCAGMIADARRARYRYQMILLFELCSRGRATPPLWGTIARLFPSAAYSSRAPDWDRRRARTLQPSRPRPWTIWTAGARGPSPARGCPRPSSASSSSSTSRATRPTAWPTPRARRPGASKRVGASDRTWSRRRRSPRHFKQLRPLRGTGGLTSPAVGFGESRSKGLCQKSRASRADAPRSRQDRLRLEEGQRPTARDVLIPTYP